MPYMIAVSLEMSDEPNFIICVADASAYKQFGNSVAVPAIQATASEIIKHIVTTKSKRYGTKR